MMTAGITTLLTLGGGACGGVALYRVEEDVLERQLAPEFCESVR
jgi:hypothetical protein